jgi:hypothetical protein
MNDYISVLQKEIKELRQKLEEIDSANNRDRSAVLRKLRLRERSLADEETAEGLPPSFSPYEDRAPALRTTYVNMPPIRGIQIYLEKAGSPRPQQEIIDELVAGGAAINKKRGLHNVRLAIEENVRLGTLTLKNGLVGLKEWEHKPKTKK